MTVQERYSAALRQILVLESAYPCLAEISELWYFLPASRPNDVSREGRYVLFAYRAAAAARDELRQRLVDHGAEKWAAALEAEAEFFWEIECSQRTTPLSLNVPAIPEFATLTGLLSAA
jgi:hypothetical protein